MTQTTSGTHLRPTTARQGIAAALALWLGTRIATVLLTVGGAWLVTPGEGDERPRFLDQWDRWDVGLFRKVAEFGYFSDAYPDRTEPFFPAMPFLMRAVHVVVPHWIAAGLVVSFLAGAVACVALWRLAHEESGPVVAHRAVLYLLLFPYAVFLFAGYSEALFLAFVTTAWLCARHEHWAAASVLAACACATRVSGVAFAAALAVHYATTRGSSDEPVRARLRRLLSPALPWLALPAVPVILYFAYLESRTGHWDAYAIALQEGWGRTSVSPIQAFQTTWDQARNVSQSAQFLWSWRAEILAMLAGVGVTVALLVGRRWGEATYVGLNVALLSTSSYYASTVRGLLIWFPAFLLLARFTAHREWAHWLVIAVWAPLMAALTLAFTQGAWLG